MKSPEYRQREKEWRQTPQAKKSRNAALREKRKRDPLWKLKRTIIDRSRHDLRLKGKFGGKSIEEYLDDSLQQILDHILASVSIEDYLAGKFQMDHIIPYNTYILQELGDPEFRKCWSKDNLRLISKEHNIKRKRAMIDWRKLRDDGLLHLFPKGPTELFR